MRMREMLLPFLWKYRFVKRSIFMLKDKVMINFVDEFSLMKKEEIKEKEK
jgi:hypothetical protein